MPNRILKESICTSDTLNGLTSFEEVVFYRLIVNVDDFGRMDARPKILASRLFPLKDIRAKQVEDALRSLSSAELVDLYEVDGRPFLQMRTWDRHQTPRAKTSKYPAPEEGIQADASRCMQMNADASNCKQMQADAPDIRYSIFDNDNDNDNDNDITPLTPHRGVVGDENPKKSKVFVKPTVEQIREYCIERNNNVDPETFYDFYESKGWVIGKNPMKDWKAAVRTWEKGNGRGFGNAARKDEPFNVFAQIQERERRGI